MIYVILTAAGIGSRFNSDVPKQFIKLDDKELLKYTIDCFDKFKIYVGLSKEYIDYFNDDRIIKYIGGKTGCETIKLGLDAINDTNDISDDDVVIISDGNRPLTSNRIINEEINFILNNSDKMVCPYLESFGLISSDGTKTIDRSTIYQVQMPCCCNFKMIHSLYNKIDDYNYSNPMEVYLQYNDKIDFVKGDIKNIKITYKEDAELFELLHKSIKH